MNRCSKYLQKGGVTGKLSYEEWLATLPPRLQSDEDYDMRAYYDKYGPVDLDSPDAHLTDEFKKPNHPTFSNESVYSNDLTPGGEWVEQNGNWMFNPTVHNLANMGRYRNYMDYFKQADPGVKLGPVSDLKKYMKQIKKIIKVK